MGIVLKLLGSTTNEITEDKNGQNVPHLETIRNRRQNKFNNGA